jgi:hypothetical protein
MARTSNLITEYTVEFTAALDVVLTTVVSILCCCSAKSFFAGVIVGLGYEL